MNSELLARGNVLMALECRRVIHDAALLPDCPYMEGLRTPMSESELVDGELPYRVSISEHSDQYGNMYLMVLNRDFDLDAAVCLKLRNRSHAYMVRKDNEGEEMMVAENSDILNTRLEPGELKLYRIQPADEEPFTIEYYLHK